MITLRNFLESDIPALQTCPAYSGLTREELRALLADWNTRQYDGQYFEMFAVVDGEQVVGSVSLYQRAAHLISCGPEIFPPHRRKGYGYAAMGLAFTAAKAKGYTVAVQQVRTDNAASVALHEKLGCERPKDVFQNAKGHAVCFYIKVL